MVDDGYEMSFCGLNQVYPKENITKADLADNSFAGVFKRDFAKLYLPILTFKGPWCKLFKMQIIKDHLLQ